MSGDPTTIFGSGLRALGGVVALGAFGLWVWFVVASFGRLWERVLWAPVGWAMGPSTAFMIFAGLASPVDGCTSRGR